jgi:hypothetical protein
MCRRGLLFIGVKGIAGLPMAGEAAGKRQTKDAEQCRKENDQIAGLGGGLGKAIMDARRQGASEEQINAKLVMRGYTPGMDSSLVPGAQASKGGGIGDLPPVQDITRWNANEKAGVTSMGQFAPKPQPAPAGQAPQQRTGASPTQAGRKAAVPSWLDRLHLLLNRRFRRL